MAKQKLNEMRMWMNDIQHTFVKSTIAESPNIGIAELPAESVEQIKIDNTSYNLIFYFYKSKDDPDHGYASIELADGNDIHDIQEVYGPSGIRDLIAQMLDTAFDYFEAYNHKVFTELFFDLSMASKEAAAMVEPTVSQILSDAAYSSTVESAGNGTLKIHLDPKDYGFSTPEGGGMGW